MSSAEAWKAWEGRVVAGKFPLRQWLGGSEYSAVFLTEFQGQAQKPVIKLIPAETGDAEPQLSRWRAAAELSHPNLIRIFESGRCQLNGTPLLYVVMQNAEEDLSQILPQRRLTTAEVAELLPPLLDALSYLHGKGFMHGRIKPSNVMAVGDQLKLSADQIMPFTDGRSEPVQRDIYDAPERAAGSLSPAADLWSLGVTLVVALTQNAPSAGDDPGGSTKTLPEPFRGIARECLHLDPKRRCSIAQVRARLEPPGRSVPIAPEPIPQPQHSGRRWGLAAVLVSMALIVGLVLFYARGRSTSARNEVEPAQTASAPPPATSETAQPSKPASSQGEVLHQVLPDIPQSAMNTITGTIKINARLEVDAAGKVTEAKLVNRGPSEYFANLVLKAAQHWEFVAPQIGGQPAASAWLLRFRLRRTSIQVSPERVTH